MDGIDRTDAQTREANELYWESETSVNRIADRLGLSKGSLYAAIEPLASESFCPLCTARLVYMNRTALEKGHLQCSGCGTEFEEKGRSAPTRRPDPELAKDSPPAQPTRTAPATASSPAANGSHIATATDSEGPLESEEDFEYEYSGTAVGGQRVSGQLKLSAAMLSLGVGLLLARIARR